MKHYYYVTFVIVLPNGAASWAGAEMGLKEPITRVAQVQAMQKSIASMAQARDEKGRVMIGVQAPTVIVQNWIFLRTEEEKAEEPEATGPRLVQ